MVPPSTHWRVLALNEVVSVQKSAHAACLIQVPYDGPIDPTFSVQVLGSQERRSWGLLTVLATHVVDRLQQEQHAYQQSLESIGYPFAFKMIYFATHCH